MDKYAVEVSSSAEKELDSLEDAVFDRIDPRIRELANDPRPAGCKKLRGHKNVWRIRVGDYRVIYRIEDSQRKVIVIAVAHRSSAYS